MFSNKGAPIGFIWQFAKTENVLWKHTKTWPLVDKTRRQKQLDEL
jgi:hypothetical protein